MKKLVGWSVEAEATALLHGVVAVTRRRHGDIVAEGIRRVAEALPPEQRAAALAVKEAAK